MWRWLRPEHQVNRNASYVVTGKLYLVGVKVQPNL